MDKSKLNPEDRSVLELAQTLALRAGEIQRDRYETEIEVRTKSAEIDLVTEVDHACEALIVSAIEADRPEDAIVAEEGGGEDHSDSDWRWVIDPLDGTTNYAHGFPRFCVSIGVEFKNETRVGVVYDPLLDEMFYAVRGAGAWLGERRLHVSKTDDFGRALIATGFSYDIRKSGNDNVERFSRVLKAVRGLRRDGSAALDLSYVAAGRLDAYWELKLQPWDVSAGSLLVEEAGGRVSDCEGNPAPRSGGEVVSSNQRLHETLISYVKDQ